MKKHWFLVVGESGMMKASSYFSKSEMKISKVEIDTRFKPQISNMLGKKEDEIMISNIVYLGEMDSDEFLGNP